MDENTTDMQKLKIDSFELEGRLTRTRLVDEHGKEQMMLSYVPYTGDTGIRLVKGQIPSAFKMMVAIIKAVGLQVESLHIDRPEEGVIRGTLTVRNGDTVHEVIARPSEAAVLLACLGSAPIYVDDDVLQDKGPAPR